MSELETRTITFSAPIQRGLGDTAEPIGVDTITLTYSPSQVQRDVNAALAKWEADNV